MYIPTSFFSNQGACLEYTTSLVSGNGIISSGSFYSGSQVWYYLKYEMTDKTNASLTSSVFNLNILSGSSAQVQLFMVGGGGGGSAGGTLTSTYTYNFCAAGGGGGGGIVYYDKFFLSSGSYEIGVGAAAAGGNNTFLTGSMGKNTYFVNKNIPYTPFTSSTLIAYGGGTPTIRGTYYSAGQGQKQYTINGNNGGNGGGAGASRQNGVYPVYQNALSGTLGAYQTFGGLNNASQGNNGGNVVFVTDASNFGAGGGGPLNKAADAGPIPTYTTDGGGAISYRFFNTSSYYSGGGAGASGLTALNFPPSNQQVGTRGGSSYGAGGNGFVLQQSTPITSNGYGGVVIIQWPLCNKEYFSCKQYSIAGGLIGGSVTYIPCGSTLVTSSVIDFDFSGSLCCNNEAGYPITSGSVTLTEIGTCGDFIPIPPTTTCVTGSKTPLYLWNWSNTNGQCYPTPTFCQSYYYTGTTIYYYDEANLLQSSSIGSAFNSPRYLSVCAKGNPNPYADIIGDGQPTQSTQVCNYYCATSQSNTFVTGGLVFRLDTTSLTGSTWYDKSGNNNNALIGGTALSLSSSLGYAFNGSNNYLEWSTALTGLPTGSYTLQFWGSAYSTGSTSNPTTNYFLYNKLDYANGWDTIYRGYNGSILFRDKPGLDVTYNAGYSGGQKVLFTYVVNLSSPVGAIYSNKSGSLLNLQANTFNSASAQPLRFGYKADADANWFKGTVTALTLYNRALTPDEVFANYNYFNQNF